MIIKNKTVLAWAPRPPPPRWKACFLIKHQSQGICSLRKGLLEELRGRLFWRVPMATEVPGLVRASLWTCLQEASCDPRLCCSYSLLSSRSSTFAKHVRLLLCAVHSPPQLGVPPHVCHWADHVTSLLISPSRAVLPRGRPQGSVGRSLRSAQKCSVPLLMLILVFGAKLDRAQARKPTPHTHPVLCSAVQEQVSLGWVVDSRLLGHV